MKCPYCENRKTKVIDSRAVDEGSAIRRRRVCLSCDARFTTFERREKVQVTVVKRNGRMESFDRGKLETGMKRACNKIDVPPDVIAAAISSIEEEIMRTQRGNAIEAAAIGDMMLERLRQIDEVAYMRFASVYKRFGDASEFQQELGELRTEEIDRSA